MLSVETRVVRPDEAGIRLDRWFKLHYPGLGFGHLQKLIRSGQVRVDGARVEASARLAAGQEVRVPPLAAGRRPQGRRGRAARARAATARRSRRSILHEDADVIVLNKPYGLAVQGGSGLTRHVDQMLEAFTDRQGRKPRLVHRLDRDTAGVLVIARTRSAAAFLGEGLQGARDAKLYWALVAGVPRPRERAHLHLPRARRGDASGCASRSTARAAPTTR